MRSFPVPRTRTVGVWLTLALPNLAHASPLTPSGASGTAEERCSDASGSVVSERTVAWEVEWRFIDRWLWSGSSTWYGDSGDVYVYDFVYDRIDVVWRVGAGTELLATDGEITSHVSTLALFPDDHLSLNHASEPVGAGVLSGGFSAAGTDWTGTGYGEGARTTFDPDTLSFATLFLTFETPDASCTWEGTVDAWVPAEDCANGVDDDGDAWVDADDPQCQACGDGILDAHEACDDGNLVSGDLCDDGCQVEPDADGDGVPDAYDRCDGDDDTVDDDDDMRPDCLPPIGGEEAAGTAELSCVDRATGAERTETVDWLVTWDNSTAIDATYADDSTAGTVSEWGQLWGVDAQWTVDGETVPFFEGELYGGNYAGPEGDYDYFFLAHNESDGAYLRIVDIQVSEGDFLVGDVPGGDYRVDLTRAVSALFSWYEEGPEEICRIYGTFDSFGDQGPDGDGIPDGWDLCPEEDASGWDTDLDGCMDDTDGDGVTDDLDVCPGGDDVSDLDGDGSADGCDPCPSDSEDDVDGDGLCALEDPCPVDAGSGSGEDDSDGDGVCNSDDLCHAGVEGWLGGSEDDLPDDDLDGIPDACDACVDVDLDGDGVPDGCSVDADGDGVDDDRDTCPATPAGDAVLPSGCSAAQVCPVTRAWPSHAAYVRCVSTAADRLFATGAISRAEMNRLKRDAARSEVGP